LIAVDTNVLVYAHRRDSPWFEPARQALLPLVEGTASWAIPWPCVHELFAISTHPSIYRPPTAPSKALAQIDALLASPSLLALNETEGYWSVHRRLP
jgi:predicted nucleic acid-binding protein